MTHTAKGRAQASPPLVSPGRLRARFGSGQSGPTDVCASVVDVPAPELRDRLNEAMGIYVQAMGYSPTSGTQRGVQTMRHARYDCFRCRAALSDNGVMLGFAYGYTSLPGQWWHDLVARAVGRPGSSWLQGAFELSELHVLPQAQGAGIGERLLRSLADGLPHRSMVLSTPEGENRAWRLYRRLGFVDLVRNHMFPGDSRPFGVLGTQLPFDESPLEDGALHPSEGRGLRADGRG